MIEILTRNEDAEMEKGIFPYSIRVMADTVQYTVKFDEIRVGFISLKYEKQDF